MKTNSILKQITICVIATIVLVGNGCKKDNNNNNSKPPYGCYIIPYGTTVSIPSDGAGAFYINRENYLSNTSADTSVTTYPSAWFGAQAESVPVNGVIVNGDVLIYDTSSLAYTWYDSYDTLNSPQNNFTWTVSGSTSLNIPSFAYTDTSTFPAMGLYSVPSTFNINNPLTIQLKALNQYTQYVYAIGASNGTDFNAVSASATSITFSPAQLQSVAVSGGDQLFIQIVAVRVSIQIFGGKKYYFVKQSTYNSQTITQ